MSRSLLALALLLLAACPEKADDDAVDTHSDPDGTVDSDTDPSADTDTDTDTDTTGQPSSTLTLGTPKVCADPSLRDEARYRRIEVQVPEPPIPYLEAGGSVIVDVNGDGLLDVVGVGMGRVFLWTQNSDETFGRATLLEDDDATEIANFFGGAATDIDDDGDFDLLITARGRPNHLLINDGSGGFTAADLSAWGLDVVPPAHHTCSPTFVDWDNDGDLDLFLAGHGWVDEESPRLALLGDGEQSFLFERVGDTYVDRSSLLEQQVHDGWTFVGGWFDADGDGDDDLYMVNDFGGTLEPSRLVWNEYDTDGRFRADLDATGIDAYSGGMGIGLGDLDGDGQEEIAISAWNKLHLFRRAFGVWFDDTSAAGYVPGRKQKVAWGAEFFDAENDGDLDIGTVFGYLETNVGENEPGQPDALYIQQDDGTFLERARFAGLADAVPHRSMNPADLNRDGSIDIVRMGLDGVGRVDLARCGEEHWIEVELRQPAPNGFAVGARVTVLHDGTRQLRRIRAGGTGYGTGGPPEAHFGLGSTTEVDLEIQWPDGTVETFEDVPVDRRVRVERPAP